MIYKPNIREESTLIEGDNSSEGKLSKAHQGHIVFGGKKGVNLVASGISDSKGVAHVVVSSVVVLSTILTKQAITVTSTALVKCNSTIVSTAATPKTCNFNYPQ